MRDETTFLPPRTSTTSSIGISTRPILSCKLNADTRLSRLSLTFFSKPEYVWMMYHCIAVKLCFPSDAENFVNAHHTHLNEPVYNCQKYAEEENRGDDDAGGRYHVFPARPGDLLHLHANVVQKLARVLNRSSYFSAEVACCPADSAALQLVVLHFNRLRSHSSSLLTGAAACY